eukprot:302628_1
MNISVLVISIVLFSINGCLIAKLEQAKVFQKCICTISDLGQIGSLDWSNEGMRLQAGLLNVAFVNLFFSIQSFSKFQCTYSHALRINFTSFNQVLKHVQLNDSIILRYEDHSNTLQLAVVNQHGQKRLGSLNVLELDVNISFVDWEYHSRITLSSELFQRLCSRWHQFGSDVRISFNETEVQLFSKTSGIGQAKYTMSNSNDILIESNNTIPETFSLVYLKMFTKATPLSKYVTLFLGDDEELVVKYEMDNIGRLGYHLAALLDV